jgi:uncharacterized protein with HEPN domain
MDKYGLSDIERLQHISDAIGLIFNFCEGKEESDFIADQMLNSSVLYQFIIIGEAIRYIDPDLLSKYRYHWHLPRSFRNYLAHEYSGINLKQVYKTITDLLPEFRKVIDQMIESESKH